MVDSIKFDKALPSVASCETYICNGNEPGSTCLPFPQGTGKSKDVVCWGGVVKCGVEVKSP